MVDSFVWLEEKLVDLRSEVSLKSPRGDGKELGDGGRGETGSAGGTGSIEMPFVKSDIVDPFFFHFSNSF